MKEKKLLWWMVTSTSIMMALHLVGEFGGLYETVLWFDMAPHFAGGVMAGSILLYMLLHTPRYQTVGVFVLGVAAVLVGWEIFEILAGLYIEPNYTLDTFVDIVMGGLGALGARAGLSRPALSPALLIADKAHN